MPKETCIKCGKETHEEITTHVDFRTGYIEGSGQLCISCYQQDNDLNEIMRKRTSLITVSVETILDTPNDADLGRKVRNMYWETSR